MAIKWASSLPRYACGLALILASAYALPIDNNGGGAQVQTVSGAEDYGIFSLFFSSNFIHAFIASFSMILVSEIGDKTFFIAAIMAMRHSRLSIFTGAISALGVMTVLSAYFGHLATFIPRIYTQYIAAGLFVFFGLKMLRDGYHMSPDEGAEELEEVTQELKAKEEELNAKKQDGRMHLISPVIVQCCVLTFLAEWGDRSQIATIVLGAREDPVGVTIGGIFGHALCTMGAVVGGRLLAQQISVRTVTMIGGVVFLIFAVSGPLLDDMTSPAPADFAAGN